MSVGVLDVICWNNPWQNPGLQFGSSAALCTPQTSCLKEMALWKKSLTDLDKECTATEGHCLQSCHVSQAIGNQWCSSSERVAAIYCIWRTAVLQEAEDDLRFKHTQLCHCSSLTQLRLERSRTVQMIEFFPAPLQHWRKFSPCCFLSFESFYQQWQG